MKGPYRSGRITHHQETGTTQVAGASMAKDSPTTHATRSTTNRETFTNNDESFTNNDESFTKQRFDRLSYS